MQRSRHHVATLLALAIQLGLSLPYSVGLVLCVGTDGHVAVERGGCEDETPAERGDCDEFGAATRCTDTPIAASELRSSPPRAGSDEASAALTPTVLRASGAVLAAYSHRTARAARPTAAAARSTVLRL